LAQFAASMKQFQMKEASLIILCDIYGNKVSL